MTKYREILRLTALGLSQRNIVQSIGVSQKTVVKVLMLSWAVMISLCHADIRLPGYLSWNVSCDGAAIRPYHGRA